MTEEDFINRMQRHAGIIKKILFLYTHNSDDKVDLKQEIYLQAWKARNNFRGESKFSTWLYRVALNTVFTWNRKKKVPTKPVDEIKDNWGYEPQAISPQADLLMRLVRELPDSDKVIIALHLDGYDHTEIAAITGLTRNNTTVKLHRIKNQLKKKITLKSNG